MDVFSAVFKNRLTQSCDGVAWQDKRKIIPANAMHVN